MKLVSSLLTLVIFHTFFYCSIVNYEHAFVCLNVTEFVSLDFTLFAWMLQNLFVCLDVAELVCLLGFYFVWVDVAELVCLLGFYFVWVDVAELICLSGFYFDFTGSIMVRRRSINIFSSNHTQLFSGIAVLKIFIKFTEKYQ